MFSFCFLAIYVLFCHSYTSMLRPYASSAKKIVKCRFFRLISQVRKCSLHGKFPQILGWMVRNYVTTVYLRLLCVLVFFLYWTSFCLWSSERLLYHSCPHCCFFLFLEFRKILVSFTSVFCSLSLLFSNIQLTNFLKFLYMWKYFIKNLVMKKFIYQKI